MPELKRLFLKGRMNKDLDERLVPNGEYRDALNIQIGSSEGSDVGAIENILGNQVARKKRTKQLWADNDETHNYYGLPLDATCIGAIKDDINDKIYYFVTSSTVDCIIEYDKTRDYIQPVLVDTQNVLKFSQNKLITGVNIIDNYLFFTDNNSEPKKVDVRPTKFISTDFSTHSTYEGRNFIESDITVIKKSPLAAPSFTLSEDARGGGNVSTNIIENFSSNGANTGGLADPIGIGTPAANNIAIALNSPCAYQVGDKLILTGVETSPYSTDLPDNFEVRAEVVSRAGTNPTTSSVNIRLLAITSSVLDSDTDSWQVTLEQDPALFRFKFPRFAYRWKYNDNQFSCFSPFTEVAFLASTFEFNSSKGYNEGMQNKARLITLSGFDTPPVDCKAIEILYKETNNSAVYVVDDVVLSEEPDFTSYEIKSELIYKIVQSNQLLRPWDNVPRLAQAQEIVGNRLVYGNYLQNFNLNNGVSFATCNLSGDLTSIPTRANPKPSLKSLRTYQIGIVFKDEYGRETPVFTDSSGIIKTSLNDAATKNSIAVQAGVNANDYLSIAPWATHFKYFVKDSTGEYYNVAIDRVYTSGDEANVWVAFPSSERNKITDDTYLILKKGHDSNVPITATDNRYKVIAISNEAPRELTERKKSIGIHSIVFDQSFGSGIDVTAGAPATAGVTPVVNNSTFLIHRGDGNPDEIKLPLRENLKTGNYIRFGSSDVSNYYKITGVQYDGDTEDPNNEFEAKVFVDPPFQSDVNVLYDDDGNLLATSNSIEIFQDDNDSNDAKYQGRFFVKLERNNTLTNNLFLETNLIVKNAQRMYSDVGAGNAANYGYIDSATNVRIWGSGVPHVVNKNSASGRDGGYLPYSSPGGNTLQEGNPQWVYDTGPTDPWDVIFEKKNNNRYDKKFVSAISKVGTKIKFANAVIGSPTEFVGVTETQVYTIREVRTHNVGGGSSSKLRIFIKFEQELTEVINPAYIAYNNLGYALGTTYATNVKIMDLEEDAGFPSENPAIFETEPKDTIDLNIYYEASDAFPVSEYANLKTLNYHNTFTYGNGVESNRIRDDFNAPFIDKGTKASTVLEEPYEEERRATGLIYSGIFNSNSGLNDLNQFIQAEKITKDLNPIYGSIQKLHTRDTNLVTLCEDKCLRILANKDALFNADGNTNVTSNNNVLGQAVPFAGEFGISKNPESFASYGYRAYFSDKKRGVVLRLSMDGLTEISSKGMTDYFYDNLKAATTVLGSYDIYSDTYNLTLNNDTVCFKESSDGWPTRKSFIPEWGISLNADYYTMDNGMIWTHDNQNRNTFYEGATSKSSVQLIFNDNPSKIKNFKTISYEGDSEWIAPLIQTDQQDGAVTTFLDKENIYYNYIKGLNDTWDNPGQSGTLDLKQFAAQGIANLASVDTYNGNTTFKVIVKNDPADAETTYTVTEYEVEAEVGDQVNLDVTEFALNIIPNDGYVIDAADFSIGDALPSQIATVVFSNGTGGVVKATCTFDASFIMPSNDIEILIDIDGVASLVGYTINGNYITSETNTTTTSGTTAFSVTGSEGDEVTLFTRTFTASSGYYFNTLPYHYQDPAARSQDNYIVTWQDSALGDNVTARQYTVKYIIGTENETLNDLYFVANADLASVSPGTPVLNSYFVDPKNYAATGETRTFKFYGEPGAAFTISTSTAPTLWSPASLTLDDTGYTQYSITVGENSSGLDINWSYTLGGDIASPFTQANPFTITQPST